MKTRPKQFAAAPKAEVENPFGKVEFAAADAAARTASPVVGNLGAYATFGQRAITTLIDALVMLPVWLIVSGIVYGLSKLVNALGIVPIFATVGTFIEVAVYFAYMTYFITKHGQTIGNRVSKTIVTMPDGTLPEIEHAGLRSVILAGFALGASIPILGLLFVIGWIANYFSMFRDPQRRCWHDIAADTIVTAVK